MELFTKQQELKLLANGWESVKAILDGRDPPEHFPVIKLFNPSGAASWLLSEIDPQNTDIAFGLCDLGMGCAELGYISLSELQSIRLSCALRIERDLHWTATHTLIVYAQAARQVGRIVTDRASLDARTRGAVA